MSWCAPGATLSGPGFLVLTPRSSLSHLLSAYDRFMEDFRSGTCLPLTEVHSWGILAQGLHQPEQDLLRAVLQSDKGSCPPLCSFVSIGKCLALIAGRLSPLAPAPPLLYHSWSFPLIRLSQFGFSFAVWFLEDSQSNTRCSQESEARKPQTVAG